MEKNDLKDLATAMKAVLLVQLQALVKPEAREKPEVVLARAGYAAKEVAELLNKNPHAVAKAIQRAGKAA